MSDKLTLFAFCFLLMLAMVGLANSETEKNKVCQPESIKLMCDNDLSCVRDLHSTCISSKR